MLNVEIFIYCLYYVFKTYLHNQIVDIVQATIYIVLIARISELREKKKMHSKQD